jgi:hypothetical protein
MSETSVNKRKRGFKYLVIGICLINIYFISGINHPMSVNNSNVNSPNSQYIQSINSSNNNNKYYLNNDHIVDSSNINNYNSIGTSNNIQIIPLTGNISINSSPTGAEIYLDNNIYEGKTPNIINNIKVGTHAITLVHAGYENWSIYVEVNSDETTSFSAALTLKTDMTSDSIINQSQSSGLHSYSALADSNKEASLSSTLTPETDMSSNSIINQKQSSGLTFDTNLITAIISLIAAIVGLITSGFGVILVVASYIEKKK